VKITVIGATAAIGAALLLPSPAGAYQFHPPIGEGQAERRAYKFMRQYPGWRYKWGGWVDCRRGRINSYSWACRVAWWRGRRCRVGRVRITNRYSEEGVVEYSAHIVHRRC
jgi:hypothetical protein